LSLLHGKPPLVRVFVFEQLYQKGCDSGNPS